MVLAIRAAGISSRAHSSYSSGLPSAATYTWGEYYYPGTRTTVNKPSSSDSPVFFEDKSKKEEIIDPNETRAEKRERINRNQEQKRLIAE